MDCRAGSSVSMRNRQLAHDKAARPARIDDSHRGRRPAEDDRCDHVRQVLVDIVIDEALGPRADTATGDDMACMWSIGDVRRAHMHIGVRQDLEDGRLAYPNLRGNRPAGLTGFVESEDLGSGSGGAGENHHGHRDR